MKRIVAVCMCMVLLLVGCAMAGTAESVAKIPENAAEVFRYTSEGESGKNISLGTFSGEGKGYFLLDIDYTNGTLKNCEIGKGPPLPKTMATIGQINTNGRYKTETFTAKADGEYTLKFGEAKAIEASFVVYWVAVDE